MNASNVEKPSGSPAAMPTIRPVLGSCPSFSVSSSTFGRLKYPVRM